MKAKIYFLESNRDFSVDDKKKITRLVNKVFRDTASIFDMKTDVNFTFYRFGKKNGGFTQAKDWIALTIPKGKIDYADLEGTLYHELHHVVRGYVGYLESGKHFLLNSLFSEGLATALEIEKQSNSVKTTHDKYTLSFVRKWLPEIKKELYSTTYDYHAWFHGEGKPRQLGYRIGKYLVDQIRKHYPDLTHKDLARKDAKELLKLSKVKI